MVNKTTCTKGFTMIELIVVVAIVGVIAAIAIPQFSAYRKSGYATAVRSDILSVYTELKMSFSDKPDTLKVSDIAPGLAGTYGPGPVTLPAPLNAVSLSSGVSVTIVDGTDTSFTMNGTHANLTATNASLKMTGDGTKVDTLTN